MPVTEIVPLADSDAAGSGLAAAAFPLTMGGMIGGIVVSPEAYSRADEVDTRPAGLDFEAARQVARRRDFRPVDLRSTLDGAYWWGEAPASDIRGGDFHGAMYKYLIDEDQATAIKQYIDGICAIDPYALQSGGRYTIDTLYLGRQPSMRDSGIDTFTDARVNADTRLLRILSESALPNKEVVLITDFQRRGWAGAEGVRLPDGIAPFVALFSESVARAVVAVGKATASRASAARSVSTGVDEADPTASPQEAAIPRDPASGGRSVRIGTGLRSSAASGRRRPAGVVDPAGGGRAGAGRDRRGGGGPGGQRGCRERQRA